MIERKHPLGENIIQNGDFAQGLPPWTSGEGRIFADVYNERTCARYGYRYLLHGQQSDYKLQQTHFYYLSFDVCATAVPASHTIAQLMVKTTNPGGTSGLSVATTAITTQWVKHEAVLRPYSSADGSTIEFEIIVLHVNESDPITETVYITDVRFEDLGMFD